MHTNKHMYMYMAAAYRIHKPVHGPEYDLVWYMHHTAPYTKAPDYKCVHNTEGEVSRHTP